MQLYEKMFMKNSYDEYMAMLKNSKIHIESGTNFYLSVCQEALVSNQLSYDEKIELISNSITFYKTLLAKIENLRNKI